MNLQHRKIISSKLNIIIQKASEIVLKVYHSGDFNVQTKTDQSPLTVADLAANKYLNEFLPTVYKCPIISEENAEVPYETRKNYKYYWLVDPLDGTKDFVKRNGQFTVNVALMEHNMPVVTAVYVPVSGECFYAYKGGGAYRLTGTTRLERLSISPEYRDPVRVICSRSHPTPETERFIKRISDRSAIEKSSVGSSLKFLQVASGTVDVYPRLVPCSEWDTAATHLIVTESGGQIEVLTPMAN